MEAGSCEVLQNRYENEKFSKIKVHFLVVPSLWPLRSKVSML